MDQLRPNRTRHLRMPGRAASLVLAFGIAASLLTSGGALGQPRDPRCVPNERDGSCLPVAAAADRVDLGIPAFTSPTTISNPLFPISSLSSVVMLGRVEGKPFRTEVTLLPATKTITWHGQRVETLVSQYVAYLDGRLHEVALDWYAQADDGSVWYFGESVFNYEDGIVANTDGTWIAGEQHPAGMIMPATPRVGDVYRPENIPGLVFEEVTIKTTGLTLDGPHGPVSGAIVVTELHQDGTTEEKTFAPGYGEFLTGGDGDLEAVALAIPADALPGPPAAELGTLSAGAAAVAAPIQAADWAAATAMVGTMTAAWESERAGNVPARLESQMSDALAALAAGVDARDPAAASQAAIDVATASLDLELRHRPPPRIDLARLELQARQLLADASAANIGAVRGDVTTMEWIWDRVAHIVAPDTAKPIAARLAQLRAAADDGDLAATAATAAQLRDLLLTMDS